MDVEPDTLTAQTFPDDPAEHGPDDVLDWDLDERDRYVAAHVDLEEHPDIEVLVRSDE